MDFVVRDNGLDRRVGLSEWLGTERLTPDFDLGGIGLRVAFDECEPAIGESRGEGFVAIVRRGKLCGIGLPKNSVERPRENSDHRSTRLSMSMRVFAWGIEFVLVMRMLDRANAIAAR